MKSTRHEKADTFFYYIKNIFMVLLFLSIAPTIISNIKTSIVDAIRPKTDVGYLKMDGVLYDSSYYLKKIDAFSKDDNIKGLIIKINSPGGMPGSAQAIFLNLKNSNKKSPLSSLLKIFAHQALITLLPLQIKLSQIHHLLLVASELSLSFQM